MREWRKLLNEEQLYNLYSTPDIIKIIKSKKTSVVGRVAHVGKMRNA
jgi:hypothetical protein